MKNQIVLTNCNIAAYQVFVEKTGRARKIKRDQSLKKYRKVVK